MQNSRLRTLSESAVMIALATGLSLIKIIDFPWGGSVTLVSMLPICFLAIRHGLGWGFGSAFVYAVLQMFLSLGEVMSWGLTAVVLVATLLLDYVLPYTLLGFSGLFRQRGRIGIVAGVGLAMLLRLVCHVISGWVLFGSWAWEGWHPLTYSIVYNGAYMLPEAAFTVIVLVLLASLPQSKRLIFPAR